MRELTLIMDSLSDKELKEYLQSLNGILEVIINNESNLEIYTKYNPDLINIEIIKNEVALFLDILSIPSLVGFDKHPKTEILEYQMFIQDLCCEYCLKAMIEDLLNLEGIESVSSDYNFDNIKDIKINIKYNSKLINKKEIEELESKFNY